MNTAPDLSLMQRHPALFKAPDGGCTLRGSMAIREGWQSLLEVLFTCLCKDVQSTKNMLAAMGPRAPEQTRLVLEARLKKALDELPRVRSVDDRLGSLTVKLIDAPEMSDERRAQCADLVDMIKKRSQHTCDVCGETGRARPGSNIPVRCSEHADSTASSPSMECASERVADIASDETIAQLDNIDRGLLLALEDPGTLASRRLRTAVLEVTTAAPKTFMRGNQFQSLGTLLSTSSDAESALGHALLEVMPEDLPTPHSRDIFAIGHALNVVGLPLKQAFMRALKPAAVKPMLPPIGKPMPFDGSEPALRFPDVRFLGRAEMQPSEVVNVGVLGETGCGKTVNVIVPFMRACTGYSVKGKAMSMLVIDPKAELLPKLQADLNHRHERSRLRIIGHDCTVRFFDDHDNLSVGDRFARLGPFVPGIRDKGQGDAAAWMAKAEKLIQDFLAVDLDFHHQTGLGLFESALKVLGHREPTHGQWHALKALTDLAYQPRVKASAVHQCISLLLTLAGLDGGDSPMLAFGSAQAGDDMVNQFFYRKNYMDLYCQTLAGKEAQGLIDFSLRPHVSDTTPDRAVEPKHILDFSQAMDRGDVLVLQPGQSAVHDSLAKAVKVKFFEAVFQRHDMERPAAYIVDEFQRFMTTDEETGDQNFLDRCRAYRALAVVGTQSVASMEDKAGVARHAVAVMQANWVTKVFFRTNDPSTTEALKRLLPRPPLGRLHVLDSRPPSLLATGECYWQQSQAWGRHQHVLATEAANASV